MAATTRLPHLLQRSNGRAQRCARSAPRGWAYALGTSATTDKDFNGMLILAGEQR